jgi:hypothetical protein
VFKIEPVLKFWCCEKTKFVWKNRSLRSLHICVENNTNVCCRNTKFSNTGSISTQERFWTQEFCVCTLKNLNIKILSMQDIKLALLFRSYGLSCRRGTYLVLHRHRRVTDGNFVLLKLCFKGIKSLLKRENRHQTNTSLLWHMSQHLFNGKFESIYVISEGNMPAWYRLQRNAGNWKFLESDEFFEIHLKFYFQFVSWWNRVTLISRLDLFRNKLYDRTSQCWIVKMWFFQKVKKWGWCSKNW